MLLVPASTSKAVPPVSLFPRMAVPGPMVFSNVTVCVLPRFCVMVLLVPPEPSVRLSNCKVAPCGKAGNCAFRNFSAADTPIAPSDR